jgi:hypothetical protein
VVLQSQLQVPSSQQAVQLLFIVLHSSHNVWFWGLHVLRHVADTAAEQFDVHAGMRGARQSLHDIGGAGPGASTGASAGGVTNAGGGGGGVGVSVGGGGVSSVQLGAWQGLMRARLMQLDMHRPIEDSKHGRQFLTWSPQAPRQSKSPVVLQSQLQVPASQQAVQLLILTLHSSQAGTLHVRLQLAVASAEQSDSHPGMTARMQSMHDTGGVVPGACTGSKAGGVTDAGGGGDGGVTGAGGGGAGPSDGQRPMEGRTSRASTAATTATLNAAVPEDMVLQQAS